MQYLRSHLVKLPNIFLCILYHKIPDNNGKWFEYNAATKNKMIGAIIARKSVCEAG